MKSIAFNILLQITIFINRIILKNEDKYRHNNFALEREVKEKIEQDPDFRKRFNDRQIQQILSGSTPSGYTWHHDGNPPLGKMQLVDSRVHDKVRHDGGYSLWVDRRE